jgi:hypothetical protein
MQPTPPDIDRRGVHNKSASKCYGRIQDEGQAVGANLRAEPNIQAI